MVAAGEADERTVRAALQRGVVCRRVRCLDATCDNCDRRHTRVYFGIDQSGDTWRWEFCIRCLQEFKEWNHFALNDWAPRCSMRRLRR